MSQTQAPRDEPTADRSGAASPPSRDTPSDVSSAGPVLRTEQRSRAEQARAAGRLAIRCERRGPEHVVALSGELDLANAQTVEDELQAAEASDAAQITLDLSALEFIDSTGLQLIIKADARSEANGQRLRLLRGPPQVHRIFEITATTTLRAFTDR